MAKTDEEEFNFEEEVKVPEKPKRKTTYETDSEAEDASDEPKFDPISKKDASIRWNSRRRMAWISLISMLVATLLMMFVVDSSRLDSLEIVITWFYMGCVSVIGSYMGFTTYAAIKGIRETK